MGCCQVDEFARTAKEIQEESCSLVALLRSSEAEVGRALLCVLGTGVVMPAVQHRCCN